MQSYELCCDMIDVVIDLSSIYGYVVQISFKSFFVYVSDRRRYRSDGAVDSQSASVIKLNNSTILYLREVNKFLALVCILREDNFSRQSKFTTKKNILSRLNANFYSNVFQVLLTIMCYVFEKRSVRYLN